MKKALTLLLIALSMGTFCQELPNVFPVSPEAASLGKYGEIPVNLATGKINYTVPLYTIDVGGFQWPIYLSYNYNGLMVEQDPPMTGLGWDLVSTGRITRQIRGIPDERGNNDAYKRDHIIPYLEWDYGQGEYPSSDLYSLYNNIENNVFDGQHDRYHINAGNVSGSYVYNEDDDVVFLNHRNYHVETTTLGIKIVEDSGVAYYFEETEEGDFSVGEFNEDLNTTVSYLLTKIELPNNRGEILFDYYPSYTYSKKVYSETEITGYQLPTDLIASITDNNITNTNLEKITFPNGEVRFNVTNTVDNGITTSALNSVSVWHNSNEVLNYDLSYSNASKSLKTLTSVTKTNSGNELPYYSFEYHSYPTIIDYKKQDFWGYYNGMTNSNLINANREIVFDKTRSGALKKIEYPTKGYTEITYEQNNVASTNNDPNTTCSYSHNETINGSLVGDADGENLNITVNVPANQVVQVYFYARVGNGSSGNMQGTEAEITVTTTGSSCTYTPINNTASINGEDVHCSSDPGDPPCPDTETVSYGKLGFTNNGQIHIVGEVQAPQNKYAKIYYEISYEDIAVNESVGGIRVSQTNDCLDSQNCTTNNYNYITEDNSSSGNASGAQALFSYLINYDNEPDGSGGTWSGDKTIKFSKSLQNFTTIQSSPVLYDRVEIVKNGGENGKTVQYFSKFNNNTNTTIPIIDKQNSDWKNGKLLKTEIYKNDGSTFKLQKNDSIVYQEFHPFGSQSASTVRAYNFAASRISYRFSGGLIVGNPQDFREKSSIEFPKEYKRTKLISKEYLDNEQVSTETTYDYTNPSLLLRKQIVTTSDGKTVETTTHYPEDASTTGSLGYDALTSTELSAVQKLQKPSTSNASGHNRIAEPIQVETTIKEGTTVVSNTVQRTNYDEPYSGIVVPKDVQTLKGTYILNSNTLEDRITHKYYDNGNVKEVSKKDGTSIFYIWGYLGQYPLVKLDNFSESNITTAIQNNINTVVNASNSDINTSTENSLRTALTTLRNSVPNAMMTSYTYDPLIGVTSITDPRGYTVYYEYDDFNRLKQVKDTDGKIISENQYHYKGQ